MNDDLITALIVGGWLGMAVATTRVMYILRVDHMNADADGGARIGSALFGVIWPFVWVVALFLGLLWGVTKLCDNWLFDDTPKQRRRKAQKWAVVKDGHPEEVSE